ncbi:MAG: XTP/dITP diphosphatase [Candidatus Brocadiaceae bacterium]|nr:XTP/dITP diphosphatase [Candidatus Brocadiaceae bacterium]
MTFIAKDIHTKTILVATQNMNKRKEIFTMLKNVPGILLRNVEDFPFLPEVNEDGRTFQENAIKKATTLARACNTWAMADDSGLQIDALNGLPGITSSRYAGPNATDEERIQKVLLELKGVPKEKRTARFICSIALATPQKLLFVVEGKAEGFITEEPKGAHGFGYDPIFLSPDYNHTFAELAAGSASIKNKISHRSQALRLFKKRIQPFLHNL